MKMNRAMLLGMIAITQQEFKRAKPKSRRRIELECRLKDLVTQRLQYENRIDKRRAA